jgi:hypothetical protein
MKHWIVALAVTACAPGEGPDDEGSEDDRPNRPRRPTEDTETDAPDPADPTDEPPGEALAQACYPGPNGDFTACVDVIGLQPAWGADYVYPEPYEVDPEQYAAPVRFVDLSRVPTDFPVGPNFVVIELMEAWKGRYGVFQPHVVARLQDIRDTIGGPLTVSSGYRNPGYNAEVGGVMYSRHQYGDAIDIQSDVATLDELTELCWSFGASYVGSDYPAHVHCDWRDEPLDPAFFDVTE